MNLRRATLSLLTTAALLGGLAACGGDDEPEAAAQGDSTAASPAAGADAAASAAPAAGMEPGTGADAYKADDPFVSGNVKIPDVPLTIAAAGLAFTKTSYTAKAGSKWTFNNADIAKHNVSSDDGDPAFKNPAKFKSPDADPGKKVTFTMPAKPGKYHIVCDYHGGMTADLTITK